MEVVHLWVRVQACVQLCQVHPQNSATSSHFKVSPTLTSCSGAVTLTLLNKSRRDFTSTLNGSISIQNCCWRFQAKGFKDCPVRTPSHMPRCFAPSGEDNWASATLGEVWKRRSTPSTRALVGQGDANATIGRGSVSRCLTCGALDIHYKSLLGQLTTRHTTANHSWRQANRGQRGHKVRCGRATLASEDSMVCLNVALPSEARSTLRAVLIGYLLWFLSLLISLSGLTAKQIVEVMKCSK